MDLGYLKSKKINSVKGNVQSFKYTEAVYDSIIITAFWSIYEDIIEGKPILKVKKKKIEISEEYSSIWTPPVDWKRFVKIQRDNKNFCLNYISLENGQNGFILNQSSRLNEGLFFIDQNTLQKAMVNTLKKFNEKVIGLHRDKEKYNKELIYSLENESKILINNLEKNNLDFQTMYIKYSEMSDKHRYWYRRIMDSVIITNWLGEEDCSKYMANYENEKTLNEAREQWWTILGKEYKEEFNRFLKLQISDKYFSEKYNSKKIYKKLFKVDDDIQKNIEYLQSRIDSTISDYVNNNYGDQFLELVNHEELNESPYYPGLKYNQNYVYIKAVTSPQETSTKIYGRDTLKGKSLFGSMSFTASVSNGSGNNKRNLNTDYMIKKRLDKSPKFYCIGGLTSFASYLGLGSKFDPNADSTSLKFQERILPITTKSRHSIGQVLNSAFYGTKTDNAQFIFAETPHIKISTERGKIDFERLCNDCVCDFDSASLVTRVIEYKKTRDLYEQQKAEMKAKEEAEAKAAEEKQKKELYAKYGKKYVDAAYEGEIITGMHEDLANVIVSKMYYVSSSTDLGNGTTRYWLEPNSSVATIHLIITIKNKTVTSVSTWRK
ncbi:MAG: hypothetical protein ACON4M_05055 [Crocinitomicaceae bacterium]